jgi:P4 family phage/plasmid primase-like protien
MINAPVQAATSQEFMLADLARSGLEPVDFPLKVDPIEGGFDQRYRIWYTPEYYKDRINRADNKYIGLKDAEVPVVVFGQFEGARLTATVEGYKKALAFFKYTGIPTICLDGCWGFTAEQDAIKRRLNPVIANHVDPFSNHLILFDGDWKTNAGVGSALTTYSMLLASIAVRATPLDLTGIGEQRLGADDWIMAQLSTGAKREEIYDRVLACRQCKLDPLEGAKSHFVTTPELFEFGYIDATDAGLATLTLQLYGHDNLKYLNDVGKWATWDSRGWTVTDRDPFDIINIATQHLAKKVDSIHKILHEVDPEAEGAADRIKKLKGQLAEYKSGLLRGRSLAGMRAVTGILESRCADLYSAFDANPNLLGFPNGLYDLAKNEFRAPTHQDKVSKYCAWDYVRGATDERFDTFIREITSDDHGKPNAVRAKTLQYRLGQMLYAGNKLTTFDIWQGEGANGKSVLAKLLSAGLGEYAANIPAKAVLSAFKTEDKEKASPFMIKAIGKRIVFLSETTDTAYLDEGSIKLLTGSDKFAARDLYQSGGEYDVTFNLILLTNALPHIAQGGRAMWDRMHVSEFKCRWKRPNNVHPSEQHLPIENRWYMDEAVNDPSFMQAVLAWIVEGAAMERHDYVSQTLEAYQREEDVMGKFADEMDFVFDPEGYISTTMVYQLYVNWIKVHEGKAAVANNIFSRRFCERFSMVEKTKHKQVRAYKGISLKDGRF